MYHTSRNTRFANNVGLMVFRFRILTFWSRWVYLQRGGVVLCSAQWRQCILCIL